MSKQERLLGDIRALTVEMAIYDLDMMGEKYLPLVLDILKQLRADGAPMYPIVEFVKSSHSVEHDNDGQTVIYLDDMPDHSNRCPSCGELFEVEVEDGEDCLKCQVDRYPEGLGL